MRFCDMDFRKIIATWTREEIYQLIAICNAVLREKDLQLRAKK